MKADMKRRIERELAKAIDKLGYQPEVLLLAFHMPDGRLVWGYVYRTANDR